MNSRDSFPRWKFKNRAPTSCSPGPILWTTTVSFELHAEMAEEIDLEVEKCTFRNFGSSVTLTLTLDRVEVTLVRICGRGLTTHQIRWKSENFLWTYGRTDVRTDGRTHLSSNLLGHRRGDDLITLRIQQNAISSEKCNFFLGNDPAPCKTPSGGSQSLPPTKLSESVSASLRIPARFASMTLDRR